VIVSFALEDEIDGDEYWVSAFIGKGERGTINLFHILSGISNGFVSLLSWNTRVGIVSDIL
jgi:hypothetical protein